MYKSNRERTRDLLLEYDIHIMPPRPRAAGLSMIYTWLNSNIPNSDPIYSVPIPETAEFSVVYPWESVGLSILSDQIFILASNSGYTGTREEFHHYFGSYLENNRQEILFEHMIISHKQEKQICFILIQMKRYFIIGIMNIYL